MVSNELISEIKSGPSVWSESLIDTRDQMRDVTHIRPAPIPGEWEPWIRAVERLQSNFVKESTEMKDLQSVKETLIELNPDLLGSEEEEAYQAALILLSSLPCGPGTADLVAFTGLPPSLVAEVRGRMIAGELWSETGDCLNSWFTKNGVFRDVVFWADVLVAQGLLVRRWVEHDGSYYYFAAEFDPVATKTVAAN